MIELTLMEHGDHFPQLMQEILDRYGHSEYAKGACATFALAKLGTLAALGVPTCQLAYAEVSTAAGIGHMIALWMPDGGVQPYVLDMLPGWQDRIRPLEQRQDLRVKRIYRYETGEQIS